MSKILIKLFIRDYEKVDEAGVRAKYGKLAGLVGIVSNILLFGVKVAIGIVAGSISIIADAINNLSDAGASIIMLVGFKLSEKPADKEHPYGHARTEYIAGLVVAFLITMIGIEIGKASLEKIIEPTGVEINWVTMLVLGIAILAKLWQYSFYRYTGKKIKSVVLEATAQDSINDVLTTSCVFGSMMLSYFLDIKIDGIVGILVAIFIIYSGIKLVIETIGPLIGTMPPKEQVEKINNKLMEYDDVIGVHDITIHNYGVNVIFATAHVEVDMKKNFLDMHDMISIAEHRLLDEDNINLLIHLDPIEIDNPIVNGYRDRVKRVLKEIDEQMSMHDFRVVNGKQHKSLIFDLLVPRSYKLTDTTIKERLEAEMKKEDEGIAIIMKLEHSLVPSLKTIKEVYRKE